MELFNLIHHVDPFDYPNSPFVRFQEFNDSVYDDFKFVWKSRKYNDAGWLTLTSLGKLLKENDALKTSIGSLKSSGCEEKLIKENMELKDTAPDTHKKFKSFSVYRERKPPSFNNKPEI